VPRGAPWRHVCGPCGSSAEAGRPASQEQTSETRAENSRPSPGAPSKRRGRARARPPPGEHGQVAEHLPARDTVESVARVSGRWQGPWRAVRAEARSVGHARLRRFGRHALAPSASSTRGKAYSSAALLEAEARGHFRAAPRGTAAVCRRQQQHVLRESGRVMRATRERGGVLQEAPDSSSSKAARGIRQSARCIECTRPMLHIASSGTEAAGAHDTDDGMASDLLHVLLIRDEGGNESKSEGQSCPRCRAPAKPTQLLSGFFTKRRSRPMEVAVSSASE